MIYILLSLIMFITVSMYGSDIGMKISVRVMPLNGAPQSYSCACLRTHILNDLLELFFDLYPQFKERKKYMSVIFYPPQNSINWEKLTFADLDKKIFDAKGHELSDVICYLVENKQLVGDKKHH